MSVKLSPLASAEIRAAASLYRDLHAQQLDLGLRTKRQRELVKRMAALSGAAAAELGGKLARGVARPREESIQALRGEVSETKQRLAEVQADLDGLIAREASIARQVADAHRVASNLMNLLDVSHALLREEIDWPSAGLNPARQLPEVA